MPCGPLLLQEVFIDEAGSSLIVKVGADGERIGVVDIWWDEAGKIQSSTILVPAAEFPTEPRAEAYRQRMADFLKDMMSVPIATVPSAMSSKRVRFEASGMATFLLSMVKRGLKKDGVEMIMLQGGAVRAKADYSPGPFTMGDLFKEVSHPTRPVVFQ